MKKKIIFAITTGLFAIATVFNINILQANSVGDVSLESISVMAQAQWENIPMKDNWGDCILCDAGIGSNWDTVMITCYYLQGANGTCRETPCNYGFC